MYWFGLEIYPLLTYMDRRLTGIPITSLPMAGPSTEDAPNSVLPPAQQHYRVIAYADDVKPSITCMQEFYLVDRACSLLERVSGVKLHRDPAAGKVKFLALGRWRGTLTQEDLPHQYVLLSDHLDFVGVELRATFDTQTLHCQLLCLCQGMVQVLLYKSKSPGHQEHHQPSEVLVVPGLPGDT